MPEGYYDPSLVQSEEEIRAKLRALREAEESQFGFRDLAAFGVRGLSALVPGGVPGAIAGGVGEAIAQTIEPRPYNVAQMGTQAGLGAIPFGRVASVGRGLAKGATLGAGGAVATQQAERGLHVPDREDIPGIAFGTVAGGGGGAISGKLQSMFARPGAATGEALPDIPASRIPSPQPWAGPERQLMDPRYGQVVDEGGDWIEGQVVRPGPPPPPPQPRGYLEAGGTPPPQPQLPPGPPPQFTMQPRPSGPDAPMDPNQIANFQRAAFSELRAYRADPSSFTPQRAQALADNLVRHVGTPEANLVAREIYTNAPKTWENNPFVRQMAGQSANIPDEYASRLRTAVNRSSQLRSVPERAPELLDPLRGAPPARATGAGPAASMFGTPTPKGPALGRSRTQAGPESRPPIQEPPPAPAPMPGTPPGQGARARRRATRQRMEDLTTSPTATTAPTGQPPRAITVQDLAAMAAQRSREVPPPPPSTTVSRPFEKTNEKSLISIAKNGNKNAVAELKTRGIWERVKNLIPERFRDETGAIGDVAGSRRRRLEDINTNAREIPVEEQLRVARAEGDTSRVNYLETLLNRMGQARHGSTTRPSLFSRLRDETGSIGDIEGDRLRRRLRGEDVPESRDREGDRLRRAINDPNRAPLQLDLERARREGDTARVRELEDLFRRQERLEHKQSRTPSVGVMERLLRKWRDETGAIGDVEGARRSSVGMDRIGEMDPDAPGAAGRNKVITETNRLIQEAEAAGHKPLSRGWKEAILEGSRRLSARLKDETGAIGDLESLRRNRPPRSPYTPGTPHMIGPREVPRNQAADDSDTWEKFADWLDTYIKRSKDPKEVYELIDLQAAVRMRPGRGDAFPDFPGRGGRTPDTSSSSIGSRLRKLVTDEKGEVNVEDLRNFAKAAGQKVKRATVGDNPRRSYLKERTSMSMNEELIRMGRSGKQIFRKLAKSDQFEREYNARWANKYKDVVDPLTEAEMVNLADHLDRGVRLKTKAAAEAAPKVKEIFREINEEMGRRGANFHSGGKAVNTWRPASGSYWPKATDLRGKDLIDELTKRNVPLKEAKKIERLYRRTGELLTDPQYQRAVDEVANRKSKEVGQLHIEGLSRLIARTRELGPKDITSVEKGIKGLIDQTPDPKRTMEILRRHLGKETPAPDPAIQNVLRAARTFAVWTKLQNFAIANVIGGQTNILMRSSTHPGIYLGEVMKLLRGDKGQRKIADEAGTLVEISHGMLEELNKYNPTRIYGIKATENINRIIASGVGRGMANVYFKELRKNPSDSLARKRLEELVLEDADRLLKQKTLTEAQLRMAAGRLAEISQGQNVPRNIPYGWASSHPAIQLATIFKKYAFQGTKATWDAIKQDPKRNIPIFLAVSQVAGTVIGAGKSTTIGAWKALFEWENPIESIKEEVQNRHEYVGRTFNIEDPVAARILDNAFQSFAFGIPADLIQAVAQSRSGIIEAVAGPTIGDVSKVSHGAWEVATGREGAVEEAAKTAARMLPLPLGGGQAAAKAIEGEGGSSSRVRRQRRSRRER